MQLLENKETITSLELVKQINIFRNEDESKSELAHSDLLKIIRDEFEEEIGQGNISESSYFNSQNKEQPMFELTLPQAKQVLVRESKTVRKAVIAYIEKLEAALKPKDLTRKEILLLALEAEERAIEAESRALLAEKTVSILTHVSKTYTATEIAQELGFKSAMSFNKALSDKRIQYKQNETWILYSRYSHLGYVDIKQEVLDTGKIVYHRRWTQIGREFLVKLFNVSDIKLNVQSYSDTSPGDVSRISMLEYTQ